MRCWKSSLDQENSDITTSLILFHQAVYVAIERHTSSDHKREVGGFLCGLPGRTPGGRLHCVIQGHIPARYTHNGPTHVTFTSNTLIEAHEQLNRDFPGQEIVGWYHTHPGLSLFLSSFDVWLHSHFFPKPWQVALVIDPIAGEGGFFCYENSWDRYVHPHRYRGFYELGNDYKNSVVRWKNLREEAVEQENLSA